MLPLASKGISEQEITNLRKWGGGGRLHRSPAMGVGGALRKEHFISDVTCDLRYLQVSLHYLCPLTITEENNKKKNQYVGSGGGGCLHRSSIPIDHHGKNAEMIT